MLNSKFCEGFPPVLQINDIRYEIFEMVGITLALLFRRLFLPLTLLLNMHNSCYLLLHFSVKFLSHTLPLPFAIILPHGHLLPHYLLQLLPLPPPR